MHLLADADLRLDAAPIDYVLLGVYFVVVLGIGALARRSVSSSLDFFLSGRSLPAWVTGLAFISANLGAVEIFGMTANGAQYGIPTMHYYWIGAIPAMVFLGLVMMPFYYGSKVRSVPEFLLRRFGKFAHLVNGLSFAAAQVLIAGVNLFALATVVNLLLGWPLWLSVVVAAVIVLAYTSLGGLKAAVYNEVMQFFVIVAMLLPLTFVGLHKVGGWDGLVAKITAASPDTASEQLNSWPGMNLTGIGNATLSVLGIVFGLGFVLSFGYWTTNFAEVQRAMSAKSMSAARRTPLIGAYPKTFIALIIIIPGMIAAVLVPELAAFKQGQDTGVTYNNAILLLIRDLLPNGMLGIAITGLLAAFMAGMAANVSSFNTVFTYDLWQAYVRKDKPDAYYLKVGRVVTALGCLVAIGTAFIASNFTNIMDYLQTLFGFFNAPLFATFLLGMFWKRMTPLAGGLGLIAGTASAITVDVLNRNDVLNLAGQGASFVAASAAFVVDIVVSVLVSLATRPKPDSELVGLVWSLTPRDQLRHDDTGENAGWYRKPGVLAAGVLVVTVALNIVFW
ncbi:sodium:solute symporter family protein [Actinokineospora globicatena]|uniref:sodium:solute symporter family protein n=1 Tax=Actinokineospora globicatena TaxID=103729 RepID=UPI0020A43438|nr:sodium:solute symporter family protein [Actinokineospora globicatena]GLW75843.1 solute:Na+ symporter, SSS family protein [Actinokineospora globicatena]GLW82681.1 solute:Na+ symporter, SSS family protein [Actinokineospora globicatena]